MKKLVFSFGRFNPPTTGHEVLLKKVVAVAKKENADAMVYSSQSNDPKKNPLPYKEKTIFMKAMFPKHKKVIQYDVGVKNAFDTLSTVYAKGYRDVTMVVGSDRVTEFEKILNKYNDVEGRHGYYNFESGVKVVSAGARDPDAEGVTGMSASKMRAAAAANDFESFEKGMPAGFKAGQSVFDAVRKGMNLSEEMMEFMESDIEGLREFFETDLVDSLDVIDDEELFESIDEDFGAVPDFATMLAFGMAAKMSFDAVKMLVKTARGVNKIRKWAKRNGNKLRDTVNPAPNFTQFESLDENVLGRYATAGRAMRKRDNAAKAAVQAAGGKDPRAKEPETAEEWMARREYHLKYAARKGMTQPMKDLISKKTMGIHKKSASECREIHNIITGTKMDATGNWKPNEKFAVREYPHSTPDHITREYNKKKHQYRKRLQSLQTSELADTKDLKSKTEKPWYAAMKKHFASHGYISDVPKPDPLDFGITWKIGSDGQMPHRPYMESVQNGLIGLDQIKKFESVVDKLFAKYDIDFNFTRHFGDRMDDSRNNPSITLKELAEFIKKMYKRQGKSIKSVAGAEAVLKDIQSDLNIPVAVTYDRGNDEFDVVLKTIMRKKNFTSPDKVIKYEENDMPNQLPEGFMDAILGKNMKKRNSGNAEQTKISTDINRKLKVIDGLMKEVKPLGGKITRMTSFRKTPIEKMTPKDLYRALNDWYLSIDDYLNDNPAVDKRHGPTVVKLYSVWEEVSDKIQDYMYASGYNVKRGAQSKGGNIIADVIKPGGPVMVQTKKLKVDGKLVDIDYNVPKRTDAKWLKMNESVELDEGIVTNLVDKGLNKVLDKLEKMTGKHLGFVKKSTVPSAGKDAANDSLRGDQFKKEAEDFHRKAKKQWTWSKKELSKGFKFYGNGDKAQTPKYGGPAMRQIPADQKEFVKRLEVEMQKIIDMHTQLEKMMQTTGNSVKYQRTMEKLESDTNRVFKEIHDGDKPATYTSKSWALQGKANLAKAKKMTHKEPNQKSPAKFRAYANRGESVELDEMKEGDRPVWLSVYLDHKIMAIHTTEKAGRKYMVGGDGPDGHFLVKTTRKALGKRRVGQFVPRSIGKHLDNGPYPHDDGPLYSVHKESVELDELKIDMPKKGAGLGITRDKMPQVDEKDYPEYFAYLKEKGITLKKGKEDPNNLKPIQKEFAKIGVEKSLDKMLAKKDNAKFIIVSKDDYIVDGHHRWLAAKNGRQQLNVMRANVNMKELLKATNEFPKTTFKSIKNVVKNMQEVRQDSDVKDKKGTQPSKYYAADADGDKMSKSTKEKRAAYFAKGGSKKSAPGDKGAKTKESKHTKKYRQMFGETKPCWDGYTQQGMKKKGGKMVPNCVPEETVNEEKIDGLVKKSEKSGISYGILKKVYDRGMAAWKSGHRPGTTAQQWAFARVNSFVTKGKGTWGKADKDLASKVRSESFLPFSVDEDRDYKKERKNYLGTPEQMERNAARSRARRLAIKKGMAERGDGRDIHHKDNNPLNNDPKNLSSVTQKYNRTEPRKRK